MGRSSGSGGIATPGQWRVSIGSSSRSRLTAGVVLLSRGAAVQGTAACCSACCLGVVGEWCLVRVGVVGSERVYQIKSFTGRFTSSHKRHHACTELFEAVLVSAGRMGVVHSLVVRVVE